MINGILAIMRNNHKSCITLNQAMAFMLAEGMQRGKAKAIWAKLEQLIPIGEYGRIGAATAFKFKEGENVTQM